MYFTNEILLSRKAKLTLFCYPSLHEVPRLDEAVHRSVMTFSCSKFYSIHPEAHTTHGMLLLLSITLGIAQKRALLTLKRGSIAVLSALAVC